MKVITKEMTLEQAIKTDADIVDLLFEYGMHCLGCMMAAGETLEEAAMAHGVDIDELITSIAQFRENKEKK